MEVPLAQTCRRRRSQPGTSQAEGTAGFTRSLESWGKGTAGPEKAPSLMAKAEGRSAGTIEGCSLTDTVLQEKLLQKEKLRMYISIG